MRIIILNDYAHINGGASKVAITSLNALGNEGFDVTFISSTGLVSRDIDLSCVHVFNFGFHDLIGNPSRLDAAINGLWNFQCAKLLDKILDKFDPADTIVHLHTWCKSLTSSVIYEILRRRFKLVCTLHDYFTICPNGGLYNYKTSHNCSLQPMSLACVTTNCDSRSYNQKVWRLFRQVIQEHIGGIPNQINYFIAVSDYSESLIRPYLSKQAKVFRINNPIDISNSNQAKPEINQSFCFVGRLTPEKGVLLFALATYNAGVPAIIVGNGTEEQVIRITNPSAEIRGWQNRDEVMNVISSSRALVFPSLCHETQGLAVSEAIALGVPVVVSDSCAAREAIIDGETGLLFKSGNITDLVDKLLILKNNPGLAGKMGRKAYQNYWEAPSTLEKHVTDLVACYREILE